MAALLAGGAGIAFAPIFVRWSEVPSTATAFWRLALAAPLMLAWAARTPRERAPVRGDGWRLAMPGLFFAADLGFWHWSIHLTTAANATLLANFAPVFVALGGWILFRRSFGGRFVSGMLLAIAGAGLLVARSVEVSPRHAAGDLLGLVTAVFYGSYILAVGRLRERLSTARILAWTVTVGAAALLPVSLAAGETLFPSTARGWAVLAALALVSQVGGQGLSAYALAHLPAALSSVTLLLQPVMVVGVGWVLLGEAMGPLQGLGAAVILAGILRCRSAYGGGRLSSSSSAASGVPGPGSEA